MVGMGTMRDRMLRGDLYRGADPESVVAYQRAQELVGRFNAVAPNGDAERDAILRQLLRHVGDDVEVRPRFVCEYGAISIGDRSFVNFDAIFLDVNDITIGADCQIATRVQLLTAGHPIDIEPRRDKWEFGKPIVIEDNVWLGGGVIVCPGVTVGADTVVAAGAVVARDLPAGVVAGGVPARVIREIGDADRIAVPAD